MVTQLLGVVQLVLCGVVAGVFVSVALSAVPAFSALPPDRYVEVHRLLGRGYHPAMPVIVNVATGLDLVLALLSTSAARSALFVTGLVLLIGTQCVSHLRNVPINRTLAALDVTRLPDNWEDPRTRWRGWHYLRTALALCAVTVNAVALVAPV
ncbi:anthrone oxygenase family protein [Streptomyces canus]|uniref:Membrane protein n=1 Tax=Streptomyces canus TaxID=58343 RepID=A0AAW8FIE4_9ACTN|nr:DUF1772 domain-containing protein [Streptomyces canus]MDQ0762613.1 putative membrane protein [Streptomyces canus]MDQ0908915.1 putative membrane protein [Streptomyces canus]MDQ1068943.1 putative membrane protein [Streptomyces canus]